MIILLIITLLIASLIVVSALRNKVLRQIGFRNITRRTSTTLLVTFGSLIGTALISGSLTLGDSFNKTTRSIAENTLGEIDAHINISKTGIENSRPAEGLVIKPDPTTTLFTKQDLEKYKNTLETDKVDGILPALVFSTSIVKGNNPTTALSVTDADIVAFDNTQFGSENINFNIPEGKTVVSKQIADRLGLKPGDTITSYNGIKDINLEVLSINEQKGASLYTSQNGNIVVSQDFLRSQFSLSADTYNTIFVSAKGSAFESTYDSASFTSYLNSKAQANEPSDGSWVIKEDKSSRTTGGNEIITYVFLGVSIVGVIAGILLIINIYSMLAEDRKSEMGTLRAIALTRSQLIKTFLYEGFVYSIVSSLIGVVVGIGVGYLLLNFIDNLAQSAAQNTSFKIIFDSTPTSWLISFCIGMLITFGTSYIASRRISKINIVSAIRNLPDEKNIKTTWWSIIKVVFQLILLQNAITAIISGLNFLNSEEKTEIGALGSQKSIGAYLLFLGVVATCYLLSVLIGKFLGATGREKYKRIVITLLNIPALLLACLIPQISLFSKVFESLLGYSLLLLAGLTMVITLTTIITYNIDIILWLVEKTIGRFSKFNGIIKLSLRYAGENKFRSGVTILMFALVLFLVAFLSVFKLTIDEQIDKFIPKDGYTAFVVAPKNVDPLKVKASVEASGATADISINKVIELKYKDIKFSDLGIGTKTGEQSTTVISIDQNFIKNNPLKLVSRIDKFSSDEQALGEGLESGNYVFLGPQAFGAHTYLSPPEKLQLGKTITFTVNGKSYDVIIGGFLDQTATQNFSIFQYGMIAGDKFINNTLDQDYASQFHENNISFKTANNGKTTEENLKLIQTQLIPYGISGDLFSFGRLLQTASEFIKGSLNILQGFLSFALFVGIAGIAIIMVRSVNERRQQIGMLRSLGFQRTSILISFFIEASFIILLGIIIGIFSGAFSANIFFTVRNAVASSANIDKAAQIAINIPYGELLTIGAGVYIIALLFTLIPSYQASKLEPVEATNYLD